MSHTNRIRASALSALVLAPLLSVALFSVAAAATSGTILPSAGGTYAQWTPSTGTAHYALVDEAACNGNTDYVSTSVVGNRDSYAVSVASVPNGALVTQIDIKPCASRVTSGGTNSVMNVFYRLNGISSADGGSYSLTGTTPTDLATTTYGTIFIKSATTTLETGAVLTSSTKGAKLSRIAATLTYTALATPSGLTATATTSSSIALTWSESSAFVASGFGIERSSDGVSWSPLATTSTATTTNKYFDSGLSANAIYYYRVRAYNYAAYSGYSSTTSATTTDVPPTAPSGLSAVASSTAPFIDLSWSDNSSNELSFEVLRGTNGVTFFHLATTSANATSYTSYTPAGTSTYFYEVRAFNSGGYSAVSNVASSTTGTVPAAPSALGLTTAPAASSTTDIILSWTDNASNETAFRIERAVGTTTFSFLATSTADTVTYTDSMRPAGDYMYRLRAFNGYGYSTYSNTATTTIP